MSPAPELETAVAQTMCVEDGGRWDDWPSYLPLARVAIRVVREQLALAAATGTAKTPKAVECEASQSGPKGNAQTPSQNPLPRSI